MVSCVTWQHCGAAAQREVAQVVAVDENAAAGNVEEARNQVGESGLACAAGAYQRSTSPVRSSRSTWCRNLVFALGGRVGKADVLKLDGLSQKPFNATA